MKTRYAFFSSRFFEFQNWSTKELQIDKTLQDDDDNDDEDDEDEEDDDEEEEAEFVVQRSIGPCVNGQCPAGHKCSSKNTCEAVGKRAVGPCVNGKCPAGYRCSSKNMCT